MTDYGIQQAAYEQYLQAMGKRQRNTGAGTGIGTLAGAGIALGLAPFTGGLSAKAIDVGAGLGGAGGSLFNQY